MGLGGKSKVSGARLSLTHVVERSTTGHPGEARRET